MKKIVVRMLMLMIALAVSQVTLADSKDKTDKGQGKPVTEHRGFGYGHARKGVRPQWEMKRPGNRRGFDQAKWDSVRAAHREAMQQKRDSLLAAHPDFKQKMDSLKHGRGPKFHHSPMMGRFHRFHRHHPHFRHTDMQQPEVSSEVEAKATEMETTAIREVSKTQDASTYDLQGRQITGQQGRGIVIRNGRKYVR